MFHIQGKNEYNVKKKIEAHRQLKKGKTRGFQTNRRKET